MGENKMNGRAIGSAPAGHRSVEVSEGRVLREKCGGRVLGDLNAQTQRLEMLVASLEETFGPVLRHEGVCDSTKESEPVAPMPEFLEHVRQRVYSIESSLDRIQSVISRSEL